MEGFLCPDDVRSDGHSSGGHEFEVLLVHLRDEEGDKKVRNKMRKEMTTRNKKRRVKASKSIVKLKKIRIYFCVDLRVWVENVHEGH